MSRQRTAATQLVRQFAAAARPIYLVDDRRVIVYCNAACAAWAGIGEEQLIGQTCVWGPVAAEPASPAAAAARLCPPPTALAGAQLRAAVSALDAAGRLVFREAQFWPLSAEAPAEPGSAQNAAVPTPREELFDRADGPAGVLAIVEPSDRPEPTATEAGTSDDDSPIALHAELARWRQRLAQRHGLERMAGSSLAAKRVRAQVALAAAAPASVMIVGPAGSGKEHVGKAIHYRRPAESTGALVPIACATLEAELAAGTIASLSRSVPDEPGKQRTLLLLNVDALAAEAQGRVAQLLGNLAAWRLIATSTTVPARLVAEGRLRADLAAALSTLSIELPALRERLEDLPLLAQLFLEEVNATAGRQVAGFTPEALELLALYPWPGNLDELADVVRQSHERAAESQIGPRDLPRQIHLAADAAGRPRRSVEPIDLERLLARIETELIECALAQAKGNKTRAAHLLGLTRPRLYRRLVQLGLEEDAPGGEPGP